MVERRGRQIVMFVFAVFQMGQVKNRVLISFHELVVFIESACSLF